MGIFSRNTGARRDRGRHSAGTNSTVTETGYNDGVRHNGVGHNRDDHGGFNRDGNRRSHHGVNNRGYDDDMNSSVDGGRGNRRSRRLGRNNEKSHNMKGRKEKRPLFDVNSGYFNRRPSFGTWLKYTWLDILTMIVMGAIGLGVYEANPAPTRSFPVTFSDGEVVYPQFAYPLRHEIIPIWAAAMLGSLVPIFVILCMQIRIKSFWDVNNGIIGLLYSLIGAAVFQVFVKWLIGGLRPHFLDVCQPDLTRVLEGGNGYQNLMFTADICTGDRNQINDSLESMPSGHSTAAWAGFLYLYFYLNGKMKVFSNHHPSLWKLIALYAPLLGATLITGSLTIDEFHNWYDCLAGAIIGSVFAISAYRMVYASVWDFRFNHIPLTRHTPFSYGAGAAGAGGFETAVFTHKAGWGYEEAYGGAPFDSAFALRSGGGAGGMGRGMGGGMTGNDHTVGLGSKNTGYRSGDVEHNAVNPTSTTTGIGHHSHDHNRGIGHGTTGIGHNSTGLGHNRDHTTGIGHNRDHTTGIGHNNTTTGIGYNNATTGLGHHNDRTTGIGHHNTTGIGHNHTGGIGSNATGIGSNTTGIGHNTTTGIGHNRDHTTGIGHHNNTGLGHNTTTGLGHNTTTGLGHDNTGLGHNTSGLGPNTTTTTTTTGLGHNRDRVNDGYNNYNEPSTFIHHNTTTAGDGYNSNTGYNDRSGITQPTGTHDSSILHRDGDYNNDDYDREGRSTTIGSGDNRYKTHRKSLERKALGGSGTGIY